MLIFSVRHLLGKTSGQKEKYILDEPIPKKLLPNFQIHSNLTGEMILMRIPDGIAVLTDDLSLKINLDCGRCLEKYTATIHIPPTEREFYLKKPQDLSDQEDIYLIDPKKLTLDLREMLRQEILLHFPLIPLCSNHCKGLCSQCGQNLNLSACKCQASISTSGDTHKPLQHLKDLL